MNISCGQERALSGAEKLSVLLIATNAPFQYRVLRCAAQAGAVVFVLGNELARPLALSRYCKEFALYPGDIGEENTSDLVKVINDLSAKWNIDYVIPGCGTTTRMLGLTKGCLRSKCFPVPSSEVFDTLNDKSRFIDLCRKLNIPHPSSVLLADASELRVKYDAGQLHFPLIAKPVDGYGSSGVVKLEARYADAAINTIDYKPVLLQDFVEGEDICISLFCVEGVCTHRVIYKRKGGIYFFAHDSLSAAAQTIARHFKFSGVICFDARMAPDGSIRLIECNPRFWYNMDFALVAGINFVGLGIGGGAASSGAPAREGRTFSSPYSFASKLFFPWTIGAQDVAMLRYWLADPIPLLFIEAWLTLPGLISARLYRGIEKLKSRLLSVGC